MTASDEDLIQKGQDDLIKRGDALKLMQLAIDVYGQNMRGAADKKEKRDWQSMLISAVDIRYAIKAIPAVQVAVTPLQFIYGKAESVIGNYLIDSGWKDKVGGDRWWAWAGPTDTDNDRDPFYVWQHGTRSADEEAAKAAAQADYDARIRSALTAHPSPEQVTAYSDNDVAALVEALEALIQQTYDCEKELTEVLHHIDFCGESEPLAKARSALARVKGGDA